MALLIPGAVFIHIPKTGGQWVASALERTGLVDRQLGVVHSSPDELIDQPEFHSRDQVFAFVRHPLTWYQSMWAHRMDEDWEPIDAVAWFSPAWISFWEVFTEKTRSGHFPTFVEKCLEAYPEGFVSELYRRYTEGCTRIGTQENLAADLVEILTALGLPFDTGRLLQTQRKNVRGRNPRRKKESRYPERLARDVVGAEKWVLERFYSSCMTKIEFE